VRVNAWTQEAPLAVTRTWPVMALGSLFFAVLTAVGALISFPLAFSPVPVTLQTLFAVLAGAVLGPVWGPVSQAAYIGGGLSGLPVFAGGTTGPGVLAGPTGGYLVGFVVGAWLAGLITRPGASWGRLLAGLLIAHLAIFVTGISHLMVFTGSDPAAAIRMGFLPFLPGLALKTALGAGVVRSRRVVGWFRP